MTDIPIDFRVKFLQNVNNDGIFGSKATGEPAITLSIVVVFALRHAIDSFRLDNGQTKKWYRLGMNRCFSFVACQNSLNHYAIYFRLGKYP